MKKFFLLMLTIFLTAGCGGQGSDNSGGKNPNAIRVGIDDEYAPMGFHNAAGELVGFDIDLANEAARRLGVNFEFTPINWNKKRNEITSGRIDMIWNGLDISDERKEYMVFSKPYMDNRQILLVKHDKNFDIHSEYDLAGNIVALQAGSTSEDYIRDHEDLRNSFKELKTYPNFKAAFADLDNGVIDVLICDEIAGRYEINKNPGKFDVIEVRVGLTTEIAIGFGKQHVKLRDNVQKVFDEMVKDGTAKKISNQWFNADLITSRR